MFPQQKVQLFWALCLTSVLVIIYTCLVVANRRTMSSKNQELHFVVAQEAIKAGLNPIVPSEIVFAGRSLPVSKIVMVSPVPRSGSSYTASLLTADNTSAYFFEPLKMFDNVTRVSFNLHQNIILTNNP